MLLGREATNKQTAHNLFLSPRGPSCSLPTKLQSYGDVHLLASLSACSFPLTAGPARLSVSSCCPQQRYFPNKMYSRSCIYSCQIHPVVSLSLSLCFCLCLSLCLPIHVSVCLSVFLAKNTNARSLKDGLNRWPKVPKCFPKALVGLMSHLIFRFKNMFRFIHVLKTKEENDI